MVIGFRWTDSEVGQPEPVHFTSNREPYKISRCICDSDQKSETLAKSIIHLIAMFGQMKQISTDRGLSFLSKITSKLYEMLGIKRVRSIPHNPPTQSIVERRNRSVWSLLRPMVNEQQEKWDSCFDFGILAMRSQVGASTGFTP